MRRSRATRGALLVGGIATVVVFLGLGLSARGNHGRPHGPSSPAPAEARVAGQPADSDAGPAQPAREEPSEKLFHPPRPSKRQTAPAHAALAEPRIATYEDLGMPSPPEQGNGEAGDAADAAAGPPVTQEEARAALARVGMDVEAERTWTRAISDPTRPADERKDLIEDLNEAGFANPDSPTMADLPLIRSRLALIGRLAPNALDDTNAAAFEEARKDLTAMESRLTGG